MKSQKLHLSACIIIGLLFLFQASAEAKFINTFIIRIGGNSLHTGDEVHLAKHDIIFCNKFHYDDIRGDTWRAIKQLNPNAEIYLYGKMCLVHQNTGNYSTVSLNELGRYSVSRGHSMGSLNGNHPNFFLLNSSGNRIRWSYNSDPVYWLDFGSTAFQNYSAEAILTDYAHQPWSADGLFSDQAFLARAGMTDVPPKYDTDAKWANAMKNMISTFSARLHAEGQKFAGNSGPTRITEGSDGWIDLDQMANYPDVLLEESAFAVKYGNGDIQFYPESRWLNQLNVLSSLENTKACYNASTDLAPGQNGVDQLGESFTFWDAFYYALGSYLLGKNDVHDTAYFQFANSQSSYNTVDLYYNEYDEIDLGRALSTYKIRSFSGKNIYWREFQDGYVYVNPTNSDINSISLPEACKLITHSNLSANPGNLPIINSINLKSHRAALLYKSDVNNQTPQPPPPPPPPPSGDNSTIWLEAEDGDLNGAMQNESDSDASSGEYIWAANGGIAEYSINIGKSGTYYIWGRILAPHAGANSFYVSTDNGNDVTWNIPITTNWDWDQAISVYFAAGQHTLNIKHREYGTQLDQIAVTNDSHYVPQGLGEQVTTARLWLEAEDGDLNGAMQNESDSDASSGEYIWAANGGIAEYSFNVSKSGTYYIWGRVLAPHAGANSFYVSTDNGNDVTWGIPITTNWDWDEAISVYFAAGQHTLTIKHREYGTQLDRILVTNEPNYSPN